MSSIFCPKNIVISKKTLPFYLSLTFPRGLQGWGPGAISFLSLNMLLTTKCKKNGSNRHLIKHNHDKRSTCCLLKNALPRNLVKKP